MTVGSGSAPRVSKARRPGIVAGLFLACGLATGAAHAADMTWTGQARFRGEGSDRSFTGAPAQWDFLQRIRVGLRVDPAPDLQIFLQMQDARAWGVERNTLNDIHNLDVHQAYMDWTRALGTARLRLRPGRQEFSYGDERIFGAAGWDNVGRAFDGVQLRLASGHVTSDWMAARVADERVLDTPTGAAANDDIFFTYNRWVNAAEKSGVEAYVLYRATPAFAPAAGQPVIDAFETTLGERGFGQAGRLSGEEEVAYQLGSRSGNDLRAYLLTGQAYAQLAPGWSAGAGCDVLSGDDPTDATFQQFDTRRIFHTGHKFYGIMDVAESLAGTAGLLDPYAVLRTPAPHGGSTRFAGHFLRVMEAAVPQAGPAGSRAGEKDLGFELDGEISVPVHDGSKIECGAAFFAPGVRLDGVGLGQNAYWGYLQGIFGF